MKLLAVALAVLAVAGTAFAVGKPEPLSLGLTASPAPAELYAVDFAVNGGRVVRFDPATLTARRGKRRGDPAAPRGLELLA